MAFADMLLEVDVLLNGSWETVNQIVLRRICYQTVNQNLNCELEGYETTLGHDFLDLFSILSALKTKRISITSSNLPCLSQLS